MRGREGTHRAGAAAGPQKGPSALILAAGASSRFLGTKQLAEIGGKTLVEIVIDAVPRDLVKDIVVVLGHQAHAVEKAVPRTTGARFVVNAGYRAGMASSIRTGILALAEDADGVLLLLADQPFVTKWFLTRMLGVFESGSSRGKIVAAGYGRLASPPVVFSREYFPELASLHGDQGARSVIERHSSSLSVLKVRAKRVLADVDTSEDLEAARRLLEP